MDSPREVLSQFLDSCDLSYHETKIESFNMVIFGGTGDLAKRKLIPAIYHLFLAESLPDEFNIVAFARSAMTDTEYRAKLLETSASFLGEEVFDEAVWERFEKHIHYFSGQYDQPESYQKLSDRLKEISHQEVSNCALIAYLATPPSVSRNITQYLGKSGINRGNTFCRLVVEKPFGHDQQSARRLNEVILSAFEETQVYRIDHYLGKETVQNIIALRFANGIFEPLWNHRYVDHVQITVAETLGIGARGSYFEEAGIIRDMVQNHLLQLLALVAMEPPIGLLADFIRDEKVKVFRSVRPIKPEMVEQYTVRGQYGAGKSNDVFAKAYREEDKVDPASLVETFVAIKFFIDNWRWAGIPFYLRTGKRLAETLSEIVIQFRQAPLRLFGRTCDQIEANRLIIRIQPDEGITLRFGVKRPGTAMSLQATDMVFNYKDAFTIKNLSPYERLLLDCMAGDQSLFVRRDGIEAMWGIIDPIIEGWQQTTPPPEFPNYESFSWGPASASEFIQRDSRTWQQK